MEATGPKARPCSGLTGTRSWGWWFHHHDRIRSVIVFTSVSNLPRCLRLRMGRSQGQPVAVGLAADGVAQTRHAAPAEKTAERNAQFYKLGTCSSKVPSRRRSRRCDRHWRPTGDRHQIGLALGKRSASAKKPIPDVRWIAPLASSGSLGAGRAPTLHQHDRFNGPRSLCGEPPTTQQHPPKTNPRMDAGSCGSSSLRWRISNTTCYDEGCERNQRNEAIQWTGKRDAQRLLLVRPGQAWP